MLEHAMCPQMTAGIAVTKSRNPDKPRTKLVMARPEVAGGVESSGAAAGKDEAAAAAGMGGGVGEPKTGESSRPWGQPSTQQSV